MGEEKPKKVDSETTSQENHSHVKQENSSNDVASEKSLVPFPDEKVSHSKSPATVEKVVDPATEKSSSDLLDRDAVLAKVETEKRLALIKAWEESEKTKAENKAYKKLSTIGAWENSKKASVEAQLKMIEEKIEKKKAEYAEKMNNKIAGIHKAGEEKRAMVEAKRGEDFLKVEETAAKFRAAGITPKKLFGCFSFFQI
ncbi:remorin 1.4-like [Cornus florida]|uniref:remorin 1.4-like n=1 Tax=Cornus florida TaxID=4283 RepID=UPI00289D02C5|nr:remorin 1.4-like [Cornus florida]